VTPARDGEADTDGICLKELTEEQQFQDAVELQNTIWGFGERGVIPVRFFFVTERIGGHIIGAFDGSRLVAFCLAVPGVDRRLKPYLHSHMLGVLPEYRARGIGRRLKLIQRSDALARGIDLIEWTFDPLELGNARFNIELLGATVSAYARNEYGASFSHVPGALPSDRCVAGWRLNSERVRAIVAGDPARHRNVSGRIMVPADIAKIRREDPRRAREIQQGVAGDFERFFAQGLEVNGFELTAEAGTYLLGAAV